MATKNKTEAQIISEAMGLLGRRKSEKKRAAVARNNINTRFKTKPLDSFACTCGKCPDNPKTYCPRGRAIIRRAATDNAKNTTPDLANFAQLAAQRQGEIRALATSPKKEREAALSASAQVAAAYYATPEGEAELADWRALQGEPFHE